jgi:hypothetical protein
MLYVQQGSVANTGIDAPCGSICEQTLDDGSDGVRISLDHHLPENALGGIIQRGIKLADATKVGLGQSPVFRDRVCSEIIDADWVVWCAQSIHRVETGTNGFEGA